MQASPNQSPKNMDLSPTLSRSPDASHTGMVSIAFCRKP